MSVENIQKNGRAGISLQEIRRHHLGAEILVFPTHPCSNVSRIPERCDQEKILRHGAELAALFAGHGNGRPV